jgi:hypothetical protein
MPQYRRYQKTDKKWSYKQTKIFSKQWNAFADATGLPLAKIEAIHPDEAKRTIQEYNNLIIPLPKWSKMEALRNVQITIEIDTNKSIYRETVGSLQDAIDFWNEIMESIDPNHIPVKLYNPDTM